MPTVTAYLTSTASALLFTTGGKQLSETAPASETSVTNDYSSPSGYLELYSSGGNIVTSPTEPAVSRHGWMLESAVLDDQTIAAGTWTGQLKVATSAVSLTVEMRVYRYTGTAFVPMGSLTGSIAPSGVTQIVSLSGFLPASAFSSSEGDRLYIDVVTHSSASISVPVALYDNDAADSFFTTPTYTPTPPTPVELPGDWVDTGIARTWTFECDFQMDVGHGYSFVSALSAGAQFAGDGSAFPVNLPFSLSFQEVYTFVQGIGYADGTYYVEMHWQLILNPPGIVLESGVWTDGAVSSEPVAFTFTPGPSPSPVYSGTYHIRLSAGPYRLGRAYESRYAVHEIQDITQTVPGYAVPLYRDHWQWWEDNFTVLTIEVSRGGVVLWTKGIWAVSGLDTSTHPNPVCPATGAQSCPRPKDGTYPNRTGSIFANGAGIEGIRTESDSALPFLTYGSRFWLGRDQYRISNVLINGQPVPGLAPLSWGIYELGPYQDPYESGYYNLLLAYNALNYQPSYDVTYDVSISMGGYGESGAPMQAGGIGFLTGGGPWPTGIRRGTWPSSLGSNVFFEVDQTWAAMQSPPLVFAPGQPFNNYGPDWQDRYIPIQTQLLTAASDDVNASYHPVSITFVSRIEVDRPDGGRPSHWTGTATPTEHVTYTQFVGPGDASRSFVYVTPNTLADLQHTKHAAGTEDVWWWASYGFMEADITAPVDGPITLRVHYSHWSIGTLPTPAENDVVTYTVPLITGDNTVTIDLLLPNEGGPVQLGRITRIELLGLGAGTYLLNSLALVAKGVAYLKIGYGVPRQRTLDTSGRFHLSVPDFAHPGSSINVDQHPDYSVPVLSNAGSFVFANIGDQEMKWEETGLYGGSSKYALVIPTTDPVTGEASTADSCKRLAPFIGELDSIEGIIATYDEGEYNSYMMDSFGKGYGLPGVVAPGVPPELVQWMLQSLPVVSLSPGVVFQPDCRPVCHNVIPVAELPFYITARHYLGASIEVLATLGGQRQGNIEVVLYNQYGEVAVTGRTDQFGYAILGPVLNNLVEDYWYNLANPDGSPPDAPGALIRPRDLPRLLGSVLIIHPGQAAWNFHHPTGYHRVTADSGNLLYWHSPHSHLPFERIAQAVVSTGTADNPRVIVDPRRTVRLQYIDAAEVWETTSDDEGKHWSPPVVVFTAGDRHTIAVGHRSGTVLRLVNNDGSLSGSYQETGDGTDTAITPALPLPIDGKPDPDQASPSFHLEERPGSERRWYLHYVSGGNTVLAWSTDRGAHWTEQSGWGILGGTFPTVATFENGDLIAAALVGSELHLQHAYPGSDTPESYVATDQNGAALALTSAVFHLSFAWSREGVLVGIWTVVGTAGPAEWLSYDYGRTWTRADQIVQMP